MRLLTLLELLRLLRVPLDHLLRLLRMPLLHLLFLGRAGVLISRVFLLLPLLKLLPVLLLLSRQLILLLLIFLVELRVAGVWTRHVLERRQFLRVRGVAGAGLVRARLIPGPCIFLRSRIARPSLCVYRACFRRVHNSVALELPCPWSSGDGRHAVVYRCAELAI